MSWGVETAASAEGWREGEGGGGGEVEGRGKERRSSRLNKLPFLTGVSRSGRSCRLNGLGYRWWTPFTRAWEPATPSPRLAPAPLVFTLRVR